MFTRATILRSASIAAIAVAAPAVAQVSDTASTPPASPSAAVTEAQAAPAADNPAEIIVTAQRRAQRLQDVPIAITALTGAELSKSGINSTHDIAQSVTGMTITESGGYVQPFIRGVGSTVTNIGEPGSAATYIDGVYMPTINGQLYELANVDSIQVLKGPQGTLFGRNANTGAIIITTRQPQHDPAATLSAGYGNYNSIKTNGFVTGGLAEGIAASLAGNYDYHSGWFNNRNPANGLGSKVGRSRRYTIRGTLLLEPTDTVDVTLAADRSHGRDPSPIILQPIGGYQGYTPGSLLPTDPYDYIGNEKIDYKTGQNGVSGRINWKLEGVTLASTTAYRDYISESIGYDSDTTPRRLSTIENRDVGHNLTQELLLTSNDSSSALNWVVGGFYLRQNARLHPLRIFSGTLAGTVVTTIIDVKQITEAYAGFADATLRLGQIELTGGIRYNTEEKTINGGRNGTLILNNVHNRWSAFTPRAVAAWKPDSHTNIYASFSQGFRSGAFNANALSPIPIEPEEVDAYELGFKLGPAPRVLLNGSFFYYQTKNLQVQALDPNTNTIQLRNAAKVESYGADLDASYSIDRLNMKLGVSYLHAEFSKFPNAQVFLPVPGGDGRNAAAIVNVTGKRNVRSPELTVNVAADYTIEMANGGTIVPSGNVYYSSKFFWTVDNRLREPSHIVANATLTWNLPGERVSLAVWGRNIFNETRFRNVSAAVQADRRAADEPALYGARVTYRY